MKSLKSRLILAASLWVALGLLGAGFVLAEVFNHHVTRQFNEELFVHLDELQRLTDWKPADDPVLIRPLSDPRYDVPLSGYYWEIQTSKNILARSKSLQGPRLKLPSDTSTDSSVHTHEIPGPTGPLLIAERSYWRTPNGNPVRFIMGADKRHLEGVISNFRGTLTWSLAIFSILLIIGAAILIAYALRPFNGLRASLADIRTGAAKRLAGVFPSEVNPLVDELNGLLASTSMLIQRARTQAGNLAHGLKTPLAILHDEAHRIEVQGMPQSSAVILEQCRSMQTQIDFQIARARAVAMRSMPGTVANVLKAAEEVASALRRLHVSRGISISVSVKPDLVAACDPQDLNEMLANIVDNACKHAKTTVRIDAERSQSRTMLEIRVDDDGIGLPDEALEVVFEIGERWNSRASGSGLGLAIVRDLAQLYGGNAELRKSEAGGLSAILTLPFGGIS